MRVHALATLAALVMAGTMTASYAQTSTPSAPQPSTQPSPSTPPKHPSTTAPSAAGTATTPQASTQPSPTTPATHPMTEKEIADARKACERHTGAQAKADCLKTAQDPHSKATDRAGESKK